MNEFGNFIRDARQSKGLTIDELSDKAKVSTSLLSMIENGKRGVPKAVTLHRIADALGFDYQELLTVAERSRNGNSKPQRNKTVLRPSIEDENIIGDFKTTYVLKNIKSDQQLFSESHVVGSKPVLLDDIWSDRAFYLEVTDESMVDEGIKKGYHVLIRPTSEFNNGDLILAIAPGDKRAVLRRIYFHPSSNVIVLQSASTRFPPKVIPINEFDVLVTHYGVAIRVEYELRSASQDHPPLQGRGNMSSQTEFGSP